MERPKDFIPCNLLIDSVGNTVYIIVDVDRETSFYVNKNKFIVAKYSSGKEFTDEERSSFASTYLSLTTLLTYWCVEVEDGEGDTITMFGINCIETEEKFREVLGDMRQVNPDISFESYSSNRFVSYAKGNIEQN